MLAAVSAAPAHAHAQEAELAARALEKDPVYVHPAEASRLTVPERGQVRLEILRSAIGRLKVAVVPEGAASRAGGVAEFANDVARGYGVHGTLIVVAGGDYWAVTSYPESHAAAAALQTAVERRPDDRLVAELLDVVPRIARIDPGPELTAPLAAPDGDDFLDDLGDTFRLGVLIVAVGIALPFVIGALLLVAHIRRRRARAQEVLESVERSADDELVELGDDIRSLDLDTSMPDADRAALAEYEEAIARYDQANELLEGEPTDYRVEQARAAIAAGKRHIAAARARLG